VTVLLYSFADFLHTATLGPAIVTDPFGHQLVDPIIVSDTGFDFATLQTPDESVPEPATAMLLGLGVIAVAASPVRRKARVSASSGSRAEYGADLPD
jgi:hypothetical protein